MTTDLVPHYRRLLNENSEEVLPMSPWCNYTPVVYPPKNEFDVEINHSDNRTNLELARIFERVNKENNLHQEIINKQNAERDIIQTSVHGFVNSLPYYAPPRPQNMEVRTGKPNFFTGKPPLVFQMKIY